MADKMKKGRHVSTPGEKNPQAKLKEDQVLLIRNLFSKGIRNCELCLQFKVCPATIHGIVYRKIWKNI